MTPQRTHVRSYDRGMTPSPLATWHACITRHELAPFEALIADDAVFHSPALHTPQVGRTLVVHYLRAAVVVLNNEHFRYVNEWTGERSAVLEFEAQVDGLAINGVDIVQWNDEGKVIDFKVMVRPFKGLTALMAAMKTVLEAST